MYRGCEKSNLLSQPPFHVDYIDLLTYNSTVFYRKDARLNSFAHPNIPQKRKTYGSKYDGLRAGRADNA